MTIKGIPISDLITVAGWGLAVVLAILQKKAKKLPKPVQQWLNRITPERVERFILEAIRLGGTTAEERRKYVVKRVQEFVKSEFGLTLPDSITNLIVEFVYQRFKTRAK